MVLRGSGQIKEALRMRQVTPDEGCKKTRIMRAKKRESGDDVLVLAPGLPGLYCCLVECSGIGRRTNTGV